MDTNSINQKAIDLLDQAAFTSSAIKDKERQSRSIKDEHLYPVSKDEALRMKDLLAQARDAADDREEAEFKDKYERLGEVVDWSLSRHKTWKWPVIAGAVLFALLPLWASLSDNDSIKSVRETVDKIKNWAPCDTVITWEACHVPESDAESSELFGKSFDNANNWIAYKLGEAKRRYLQNENTIADYKQKAEVETDSENKANYQKRADYWEKYNVKHKTEFEELSPLRGEEVNKEALQRAKHSLSSYRTERNSFMVIFLLVLVLSGLYIWTGNPYGYDISRSRTRHKIVGWISKVGFWFASLCFGADVAAKLFADDKMVEYVYTSGRRERRREADVAGTAGNVVWKIALIIIGVIAFVVVAGIVMFLETAFALPTKLREERI